MEKMTIEEVESYFFDPMSKPCPTLEQVREGMAVAEKKAEKFKQMTKEERKKYFSVDI